MYRFNRNKVEENWKRSGRNQHQIGSEWKRVEESYLHKTIYHRYISARDCVYPLAMYRKSDVK